MNGLLIVAHGSRKPEANQEVFELTTRMEVTAAGTFDLVRCAFMQFASPSFESQIEELIATGAGTIVVFPYFIGSGSHVTTDIPALVAAAADNHPDVSIRVTPHLGSLDGIQDLILARVREFSEIMDSGA